MVSGDVTRPVAWCSGLFIPITCHVLGSRSATEIKGTSEERKTQIYRKRTRRAARGRRLKARHFLPCVGFTTTGAAHTTQTGTAKVHTCPVTASAIASDGNGDEEMRKRVVRQLLESRDFEIGLARDAMRDGDEAFSDDSSDYDDDDGDYDGLGVRLGLVAPGAVAGWVRVDAADITGAATCSFADADETSESSTAVASPEWTPAEDAELTRRRAEKYSYKQIAQVRTLALLYQVWSRVERRISMLTYSCAMAAVPPPAVGACLPQPPLPSTRAQGGLSVEHTYAKIYLEFIK